MQTFSSTYDYDNDNNVMLGVNLMVIIMSLAILRIYTIRSAVALGKAKWLLHMMSGPMIPLSRSSPVIVYSLLRMCIFSYDYDYDYDYDAAWTSRYGSFREKINYLNTIVFVADDQVCVRSTNSN